MTPLDQARVPRGALRWKFVKDGYETAEFVSRADRIPPTVALSEVGSLPEGMLKVSASRIGLTLSGFNFMDRVPAPCSTRC